jgi:hypothetical protein
MEFVVDVDCCAGELDLVWFGEHLLGILFDMAGFEYLMEGMARVHVVIPIYPSGHPMLDDG